MLKNVPKLFFQDASKITYLAGTPQQCILYKTLDMNSMRGDYFVAQHVITLVLKGEKIMQLANGQECRIKAGQFAYIPKDLYLIQDNVPDQGQFESWLFFFDEALCQNFFKQLEPARIVLDQTTTPSANHLLYFPYSTNLQAYISGLQPLLGNQPLSSSLVALKLQELLHLLRLEESGAALLHALQQLQVKPQRSITAFMEQHYTKPLKVADYAYLTGRSVSSFLRDFKRHYHTTPKKWLLDKRLAYAKALFIQDNCSVTEAAFAVGYENISHFIRAFKVKYDLSPKQFKIQHRLHRSF